MQQQRQLPEPKGDIGALWSLLNVDFRDREIVWDAYNPYPKISQFPPEYIFVGGGSGGEGTISAASPITSGLQQVMFLFAGSLRPRLGSTLTFLPLLRTGAVTGRVAFNEIFQRSFFGITGLNPDRRHEATGDSYVLATHIRGRPSAAEVAASTQPTTPTSEPGELNVVLVSDIDLLYSVFFTLRARGTQPDGPQINLDNVPFVLNILDELAGDDRFMAIRKRRPAHRTLTAVENMTERNRQDADNSREQFNRQFEASRTQVEEQLRERIEVLQKRQGVDPQQMVLEIATAQRVGQKRLEAAVQRQEQERDRELARIETNLGLDIRSVENKYKMMAVALPPIPPLLVAAAVALRRRRLERIGVSAARLR